MIYTTRYTVLSIFSSLSHPLSLLFLFWLPLYFPDSRPSPIHSDTFPLVVPKSFFYHLKILNFQHRVHRTVHVKMKKKNCCDNTEGHNSPERENKQKYINIAIRTGVFSEDLFSLILWLTFICSLLITGTKALFFNWKNEKVYSRKYWKMFLSTIWNVKCIIW